MDRLFEPPVRDQDKRDYNGIPAVASQMATFHHLGAVEVRMPIGGARRVEPDRPSGSGRRWLLWEDPVSYSDYTIDAVKQRFGLRLEEGRDLYASVPPVQISPLLRETLAENVPLALAISTEKARSEL